MVRCRVERLPARITSLFVFVRLDKRITICLSEDFTARFFWEQYGFAVRRLLIGRATRLTSHQSVIKAAVLELLTVPY